MKFDNWLVRREKVYSNPGSRIVDVKMLANSEDCVPYLKVVGKHNLYQEIQSHKDSVDIHVIIERYKNGDIAALDRMHGQFIDVTDFPSNYAEMLQSIIDARSFFDSLDYEKKSKFGSFDDFLSNFGSDDWFNVFKNDVKEEVKVTDDEQEHRE